jgi:YD repeat-containing protein
MEQTMALKDTIKAIAEGSLPEEEQLALLKNLEAAILAKKNQKEVEEQKDYVQTAIETIVNRLKTHERDVGNRLTSVEEFVRVPGPQGERGADGRNGKDGKDGLNGKDGQDGKDGVDGQTGSNGVSVVDAYFAADNSLVLVLSNGEEIDAGAPYGLGQGAGGNINVLTQTGETAESLATKYVAIAFETVSKNLRSADGVINFTGDLLTSIVYADGITKTLNYDGSGLLTSVVLSGSTPVDIALTKTFTWDASDLPTAFTYS